MHMVSNENQSLKIQFNENDQIDEVSENNQTTFHINETN
jgi:hypothetical protein